ncbi:bifunctional phosphoribosylaminoimidazolecarboxamide formyltransferase/IMP cyclohydrolase [Rubinisphaera sp.]|uniref:bifunctional phosphoribosylaminoimidazolecarboxamide formyltransferase/IMP cyclohydrolase n=1 Tax=Rubinisphaera sp. TaxID=2024857 RepID=UPI000C105B62|nr:bifunctional phosphoribosylaminoimidazolecarboxamide formyltransferase/IMP cyclohydrolase [Rubinisphaera sp.]MBV09309.1 bifunctional phosphoribosylaminoimidazolecarboxamide formyltransferase/inosine monophosphate cyclohydrolase [Rubinisphaera sp.]|tara:strand:+ start:2708 stop:4285 length:1578 start_codon:yes stop_codon:yes gene_type:complete
MSSQTQPKRVLVSVSDKTDLLSFVQKLVELGFEVVSTGGTRKHLQEAGVLVVDISEYTEFPEIMDGRVKTLHPRVHGGLLGRPDLESDVAAMGEHGIQPFQMVVCNLYPFEATVARPDVTVAEAIENIDIGGPSMIRSAAKNHKYLGVVTSPSQYKQVIQALEDDVFDEEFRRKLAMQAFGKTAAYDAAINSYFQNLLDETGDDLPEMLNLSFRQQDSLRYGENPHQRAAFYVEPHAEASTIAAAKQLNGKELSYNNLLDLDAAWGLVTEFEEPAVSIMKHNNPCGCAIAPVLSDAFANAYAGDPVSAFGSIVGVNREIDLETAEKMCEPGQFIEAIIAPGYSEEAFELLTTKPKWRKNVRLMSCHIPSPSQRQLLDYRRVSGGLLVQDRDTLPEQEGEWNVVTDREPSEKELRDLTFAWAVCKHVKSNAIVFVKDGMVTGVGAGQMSRLDSAEIAAKKSEDRCKGGVVASDAFFPFKDGIEQAAQAGILAAIQPGGSRNDEEVIEAANQAGMAMIFTGRRHFRH